MITLQVQLREVEGQFDHQVDSDGRVVVPLSIRNIVGEGVLTRGVEPCVWLMKDLIFQSMTKTWNQKIAALDQQARMLNRHFVGSKQAAQIDRQGRLLIGQDLRSYAGITDKAIIVGTSDHVEFWSPKNWARQEELQTAEAIQKALNVYNVEAPAPAPPAEPIAPAA